MGKITIEVKINTFGTMLYSLNHPSLHGTSKKIRREPLTKYSQESK